MISDEIRQQQKKLKDMTFSEKLKYIIYYYKWHILIISAILIFTVSFIHDYVTRKDEVFFLEVINSSVPSTEAPDLVEAYTASVEDFDPKKEKMTADYSYIDLKNADYLSVTNDQKIVAMLTAGTIDAMIAPPDVTDKYIATECFMDLRDILPKDLMQRLEDEDYKYYYAKIKDDNAGNVTEVPIGVIISDTPVMKSGYIDNNGVNQKYYEISKNSYPIYSVMYNSKHPEHAVSYLLHLLEER